ncbi:hypothetical protein CHL67_03260 [Prosthecochloris sp. GSB1]|uniref:hypothetical protein n=1 Tax=Prosthecochloris sp. GSB1 TaxID=281093 RepID=UPI000B8CF10D|nr:hypothetical protein [Prosthecochloris sp. GSB1]ASQ90073.1 hypothetical protein CHL67_03260 [Prosthecochloris sp. GSB1]
MNWHNLLLFVHVTSFAAWFGTVFASLFLLKTLEPRLTANDGNTDEYTSFLHTYIRLETKVADIGFKTAVATGLLLAFLFHGWSFWVFVKAGLVALQVALTIGYIVKAIQPLSYPCDAEEYGRWYRLFTISFTMFVLVLGVSFFLL